MSFKNSIKKWSTVFVMLFFLIPTQRSEATSPYPLEIEKNCDSYYVHEEHDRVINNEDQNEYDGLLSETVTNSLAGINFQFSEEIKTKEAVLKTYINPSGNLTFYTTKREFIVLDEYFYPVQRISHKIPGKIGLRGYLVDIMAGKDNTTLVFYEKQAYAVLIDNIKTRFYVEKLDAHGKSLSIDEISIGKESEFIKSKNQQYFGVYTEDKLVMYDVGLNKVADFALNEGEFGFTIKNDGSIFYFNKEEDGLSIVRKFSNRHESIPLSVPVAYALNNFKIDFDEVSGKAVVSSLLGVVEEQQLLLGTSEKFKTLGSCMHFIDLNEFQEEKMIETVFSKEILDETSTKDETKNQSLNYRVNRGVLFNGNNVIHQVEKSLVSTTNSSSGTSVSYRYADLILVKSNVLKSAPPIVKVIKKSTRVPEVWKHQGSFTPFIQNDNICVVYNDMYGSRKRLTVKVLDADLNTIDSSVMRTYEEKSTYVNTNGFDGLHMVKDGKLYFTSFYKKGKWRIVTME